MRVGRDEYWRLVTQASRGDAGAQATLAAADILDVLKWTNGIPAVRVSAPLDFAALEASFGQLAAAVIAEDVEDVRRIGHVPATAPGPTYELDQGQYWDGVRDLARYAERAAGGDDVAFGEALWDRLGGDRGAAGRASGAHPFVFWRRCLDVLRHTRSEVELADPTFADDAKVDIETDWRDGAYRSAVAHVAILAMFADAWRLSHSVGGYVPNIRSQGYWDEIRKLERSLPYPIDPDRDVRRVRFFNDFHDALDVLRLSSTPAALAWRIRELLPGDQGWIPPEQRASGAPAELITVEAIILAAARYAALADADYLGANRTPFASPAPTPITLDQYREYVASAARVLAKATDVGEFQDLFYSGSRSGYGGHPLLSWNPAYSAFPYRALDILMHTDRPEALWQDAQRRARLLQAIGSSGDADQLEDYKYAAVNDSAELAINAIASAAFCADVLDETGGMQIAVGYSPNIRGGVYWDRVRDITPRTHYPVDYEKDLPLAAGFIADFHDALDVLRLTSDPSLFGPWIMDVDIRTARDGFEKSTGYLPPVPDPRRFDLFEMVIAAARVSALGDTDYWAANKAPFPTTAPPPITLDEYRRYVRDAALAAARAPHPDVALSSMFHISQSKLHPLFQWSGEFPWRALDVLAHTDRPDAIYTDHVRRVARVGIHDDPWEKRFRSSASAGDFGGSLNWIAAAAMLADVLDELGAVRLSKYAPNPIRVADVREWLWLAVDDWLSHPSAIPPWLYPLARDAGVSQTDLLAQASGRPTSVDVRQYLLDQVENAAEAQIQGYLARVDG